MSKMWDIAQYVEANPDRHDQRWRLCKKLYTAKEYRLALEHLLVLKNEWEDRKRVRRYLGATLYRLERYAEAVSELKEAINIWPEEIDLREQLAQVLFKSGDLDACADAWEKIAEVNPKHKYAAKAAKAMRAQAKGEEYDQFDTDAMGEDLDQGFGMSVEVTCPQCNAKNSDEFDRCWNCHAPLGKGTPAPKPAVSAVGSNPYKPIEIEDDEDGARGKAVYFLGAGAGLAGLYALFLIFKLMMQAAPTGPAMSLDELLTMHMNGTRVWLGILLLVNWSFLLAISVDLFFNEKPSRIPEALCAGLITGGISFALTWLPLEKLMLAFMVPALVSLPLMVVFLPKKFPKILGAWVLQLALVFGFMFACASIVERSNTGQWFNPIAEYNGLLEYSKKRAADNNPSGYTVIEGAAPVEKQFKLERTGSTWLDLKAKAVTFTVEHETAGEDLRFEVADGSKTIIFEMLKNPKWSGMYNLETGKTFTINTYGPEGAAVKVSINSLLFPKF